MDRETWQTIVHGFAKTQTRLTMSTHTCEETYKLAEMWLCMNMYNYKTLTYIQPKYIKLHQVVWRGKYLYHRCMNLSSWKKYGTSLHFITKANILCHTTFIHDRAHRWSINHLTSDKATNLNNQDKKYFQQKCWLENLTLVLLGKKNCNLVNFCLISVQWLSHVRLFATPWTAEHQASLSITNSHSPPKPMSLESVMPSNHLILCHPLLLPPSVFHSIRVFSNESALHIR